MAMDGAFISLFRNLSRSYMLSLYLLDVMRAVFSLSPDVKLDKDSVTPRPPPSSPLSLSLSLSLSVRFWLLPLIHCCPQTRVHS